MVLKLLLTTEGAPYFGHTPNQFEVGEQQAPLKFYYCPGFQKFNCISLTSFKQFQNTNRVQHLPIRGLLEDRTMPGCSGESCKSQSAQETLGYPSVSPTLYYRQVPHH